MPHAVRLCYRPRQVGAAGVETAGRWETAPSPPGRTVDIALRLVLASAHAMPRGVCRRQETARGPGHVTAARSVGRHPHPPEGETGHAAWRPVRDGAPPRPGATRGCAHAWLPRRPGLPSALAPAAWERSRARRHWRWGTRRPQASRHGHARPPEAVSSRPPRLAPGRFGIQRGMRDLPGPSMLRGPDTPVGPPGGTVDSRRVSRHRPGLQHRAPMTAQPPEQGGPPRWPGRPASCPGAPGRHTPLRRPQGTQPLDDRSIVCEKVPQGRGRSASPKHQDDQRLDQARVRRERRPPPRAFDGWRGRGALRDEPAAADKEAAMGEQCRASSVGGLVPAILPRQPRAGQDLSAAFSLIAGPFDL